MKLTLTPTAHPERIPKGTLQSFEPEMVRFVFSVM